MCQVADLVIRGMGLLRSTLAPEPGWKPGPPQPGLLVGSRGSIHGIRFTGTSPRSSAAATQMELGGRAGVMRTSHPVPGAAAGWGKAMRCGVQHMCACHIQSQHGWPWEPLAIVISCLVTPSSATTASGEPRARILSSLGVCA